MRELPPWAFAPRVDLAEPQWMVQFADPYLASLAVAGAESGYIESLRT